MGNICCTTNIPDIDGRFPAIGVVSVNHDPDAPDPAMQVGPDVEQFENLNFTDSSSVDAEMEHLSKLLANTAEEKNEKTTTSKKKKK